MKVALVSDLHLEFSDLEILNTEDADVLIMAGDIMMAQVLHDHSEDSYLGLTALEDMSRNQRLAHTFRKFLANVSREFPHVVYVAGNHEFYHGKWPANIDDLRRECEKFGNIHFLEMNQFTLGDVTFIGSTLWTDMNRGDPLTIAVAKDYMNDFRVIRNSGANYRKFNPGDTVIRHRQSLNYIAETITSIRTNQPSQRFVVVGHHAPSHLSVDPRYNGKYHENACYFSNLGEFILDHPEVVTWAHGHMHNDSDYMIGGTRIVCHPRGYVNFERGSQESDPYYPLFIKI